MIYLILSDYGLVRLDLLSPYQAGFLLAALLVIAKIITLLQLYKYYIEFLGKKQA